jgi:anaerobic selenocysteine-containing dehydrogenase
MKHVAVAIIAAILLSGAVNAISQQDMQANDGVPTRSDSAVQYGDGSVTGRAAWPQAVRPRAVLAVAASDAEAAGLSEGHPAVLEGPGGSAAVDVLVRPGQRAGQAWVSRGFADVRDAFGWSWDGHRPGEPVRMEVRKA